MDNKLRILNFLAKHFDEAFTMHALAKATKIPYASFYRTVQRIEDLLLIKKVGKAKTLSINRENPVISSYLAIASDEERKAFIKNKTLIRIINKELQTEDIVLLFGSYAKGEECKESDVDLIIINKTGKRSISFSKYELIHDKEINPMFFKENEFKAMLRMNDENVGKQALREHRVLNNPERFWKLVNDTFRKSNIR